LPAQVEKDDMKLIETQKAYETRLSELDRVRRLFDLQSATAEQLC